MGLLAGWLAALGRIRANAADGLCPHAQLDDYDYDLEWRGRKLADIIADSQ
jgi:hypothetical protein